MTKDVFVQAFSEGSPALIRAECVRAIAAAFVVEEHDGYAAVQMEDGGAEIWGYGDDGGLAVSRASGLEIWELVVAIARSTGAAIIPVGGAPFVCDELLIKDLPADAQGTARLVTTGTELWEALGGTQP